MERIVVPPTKSQEDGRAWVVGPLPVLQTLRDKKPFYRRGGIQKERVIVPWAGRRDQMIGVSGSDATAPDGLTSFIFFPKPINRRAQSGLLLGLVHRFWTMLGGMLAGFIGLAENFFQGLDLGHPV
jgi:hypothetical protein